MLTGSPLIAFAATANAEKSRRFYESTVGLKFVSADDFALVFDVNGTMLRIQQVGRVDPRPYTILGWKVADIQNKAAELTERGVQFARYEGLKQDGLGIWTSPSGAKIAWFNDPDGNILSLTEF